MKHCRTALALLAALSASIAIAHDFKTLSGKEYKDATVSRIEPDGIVVKNKSGTSKVYFVELPEDVQQQFGHNPEKVFDATWFLLLLFCGSWAYYLFFKSGTVFPCSDDTRQIIGVIFIPIFILYCAWVYTYVK